MGRNTKNVLIMLGLLLEFSFTTLGMGLVGYLLDDHYKSLPKFTVVFLILSAFVNIGIFVLIYKKAKKIMEDPPS